MYMELSLHVHVSMCDKKWWWTGKKLTNSWSQQKYTVSPPKNVHLFILQITLSKINRFQWFLVCYILRKFDIDSLYICPPYLYTVTTLPWEIRKSHFSTVLFIHTKDYLRYLQYKCTSYWCQIFSGFHTPKIIKIGLFLAELFEK